MSSSEKFFEIVRARKSERKNAAQEPHTRKAPRKNQEILSGQTGPLLSKHTGCQIETIRFYEREGLLQAPPRSPGNFRLYSVSHVERLHLILHCRVLDMTLDEIRGLLGCLDAPESQCDEANILLDKHIQHVRDRNVQLTQPEKQLRGLRSLCKTTRAAKHAGILNGLSEVNTVAVIDLGSHGGGCH